MTPGDQRLPTDTARRGHEVRRLQLMLLLPLALTIAAVAMTLIVFFYQHERTEIDRDVLRIRASAQDFYSNSLHYDSRALTAVLDALQSNRALHQALARQDRPDLLRRATPLFEDLRRDFDITHLYFSGADRINLLRVHAPEHYGDRIDRITTLAAEKNGLMASGVELGPLGSLTLRVVTPWYEEATHKLIGYVEVGMEIDRVLQKLRDFFDVEVFVLLHKDYLDRQQWEDGMRALGHTPDWERFPAVVAGSQTARTLPSVLTEQLVQKQLGPADNIFRSRHAGAVHQLMLLPLQDAGSRPVGYMALIADVTADTSATEQMAYAVSLVALGIGLLLLGFFHRQVGRIGRRIESDEQALEHLATHDGLTGLYNHRRFYQLLEEEITRARRYGHSFGLLMLDIDHFKQVNDSYGHQAGDDVLRGLSQRLSEQVRAIDRVCRYGGEEIVILLPEMNQSAASSTAERLRAAVADTPFATAQQAVNITVSIGVAVFPQDAASAEALVSVADHGMYAAKAGGRNRVCHHSG